MLWGVLSVAAHSKRRCAHGGDAITAADLINTVDNYHRAVAARANVGVKLLRLVVVTMCVLFALALLVVRLTLCWRG